MAGPEDWGAVPAEPRQQTEPETWGATPVAPAEPGAEFGRRFGEKPSPGFMRRLGGDVMDVFVEGVHSVIDAPNPDLGPEYSEVADRMMTNLMAAGHTEAQAKARTDNALASMRRGKFIMGTIFGPLTVGLAGALGAARTTVSRPISEATGVPLESVEQIGVAGLAAAGMPFLGRVVGRPKPEEKPPDPKTMHGEIKDVAAFLSGVEDAMFTRQPPGGGPTERIGGLPKAEDFAAAAEHLGAPEANLRRLWEENGIHPAEAAHDALTDPALRERLTQPAPPMVHSADASVPIDAVRGGGPERIIGAAIKLDNDIYIGSLHEDAVRLAARRTGMSFDDAVIAVEKRGDGAGFLTSEGRYVDRAEASRIAESAGQAKEVPTDRSEFLAEHIRPFSDRPSEVIGRTWLDDVNEAQRATLDNPIVRRNITDPVVDRTHDVPGGAGASEPRDNRTVYIDRRLPREIEVDGKKFDPAEPLTVRETVAQHVTEELIAGGMDKETAAKIADIEYAAKAEDAWYRAHGIDSAKAREALAPFTARNENPAAPPHNARERPAPAEPAEPPLRGGYKDTRGEGGRFMGAPSEITLNEGFYGSSTSYYGTRGLYTSDALDVAHGYANRRNAQKPTIYSVEEKGGPKNIFDMEEPIPADLLTHLEKMAEDPHGVGGELIGGALDEKPKNLREVFDNARDIARGERIPADEVQEVFHEIWNYLEGKGFSGMRHKGGALTKTPEHDVVIYFNPEKDVTIRALSPEELAAHKPTEAGILPGEIAQAKEIMDRANGALDENGIPERHIQNPTPEPAKAGATDIDISPADGGGGPPLVGGLPAVPVVGTGVSRLTGLGRAIPPGRQPPPPPQGPGTAVGPPGGYGPRQPYFTYDDRGRIAKTYETVLRAWQKTFQPELISHPEYQTSTSFPPIQKLDRALEADPFFAEYKARGQNFKDLTLHHGEPDYQFFRPTSDADRLRYLDEYEHGRRQPTPELRDQADRMKQVYEILYDREAAHGSKAAYYNEYFSHIFTDPLQAREFIANRTAQMGPRWFQREREFATIRDAMDAGLRLKTTNPAELLHMRIMSSIDMMLRMDLLQNMRAMGLATTQEIATAERGARFDAARAAGLPIDITTVGRELTHEGWMTIVAPNGETWVLSPDIKPLWKNAVEAKGLWSNEGPAGTGFRRWMEFKNAWVPIKLALSGFHPIHVAHINLSSDLARAQRYLWTGDIRQAMEQFTGNNYHEGRIAREIWYIPEDQRTPWQQELFNSMVEGGIVANISEQIKIDSKHKLEFALDNGTWQLAPRKLQDFIRQIQAPIFETWIPNLKVAAYLRDDAEFFNRHPEIYNDPVLRRLARRTIAKSTENRFGEMFYGNLNWNRTLKDTLIGAFLSLGWNTGFVRDIVGGMVQPMLRGTRQAERVITGRGNVTTAAEETIRLAQTKTQYMLNYVIGSMIFAGLYTYAMTDEVPEGMDYLLPRNGRTNPDGTPHRLTHMSYTREFPMLEKHVEEHGGRVLPGVLATMRSKLVLGPAMELWDNRDYYGSEIWNENSPLYRKGADIAKWALGEQILPISGSSVMRVYHTGGGFGEMVGAVAGFGPAPAYAEKSPTQNRIAYLFREHVAPHTRSSEEGENAKERGDIRNELLLARARGDEKAVVEASQKWFKAGGSMQSLSNVILGIGSDISMFKNLPSQYQEEVMQNATEAERERYNPFRNLHLTSRYADLLIDSENAVKNGDLGKAQEFDRKAEELITNAVNDGRITNKNSFMRDVSNHMKMRIAPEEQSLRTPFTRQLQRRGLLPEQAPKQQLPPELR